MRYLSLLLLSFLFFNTTVAAAADHTGQWFFLWGYNRDSYNTSDLTLKGPGYDYTIHEAQAHDSPSLRLTDLLPQNLTLPQTNTRVGYYLSEDRRVYFGVDHLKYVLTQDQPITITGTTHDNTYPATLAANFLTYEHTDVLNYVHSGYELLHSFWQNELFKLSVIHGPDAGIVYPKTNVTFSGYRHRDDFTIAGYGASYKVGLVADVASHWFVQFEAKGGRLILPWIKTGDQKDTAEQNITFRELVLAVGYIF
jgi:hypothetical protein